MPEKRRPAYNEHLGAVVHDDASHDGVSTEHGAVDRSGLGAGVARADARITQDEAVVNLAAKRVLRGARLLDEKLPGWFVEIDVENLNLGSACNCVLGQLATDI